MEKIDNDNSYDYYQKIITIDAEKSEFKYCFLYQDGIEKLYLLDGEFSKQKNTSKFFNYSSDIIEPFFTPDWVKDGIIYQIFQNIYWVYTTIMVSFINLYFILKL